MRLIDADNVIDILEFYLTEADGIHWALRDIKEQPTAYDVDKIVKHLEAELYKGMESLDPVLISFNFGINKAIEIVKSGGAKWVD